MPEDRRAWRCRVGTDATRKRSYPPVSLPPEEMFNQVKKDWNRYGSQKFSEGVEQSRI
jgi:hypothetical protein